MKRIYLLPLLNIFAVFMLFKIAYAIPMVYTFEGTLTGFAGDDGIIAANGLHRGSLLTYNILIDFDRPGSTTLNDGTVTTYPLSTDIPYDTRWVFYADYLSGSALQVNSSSLYEDNRLVSWHMPNEEGYLYLDNNDTIFQIEGPVSPLFWTVGMGDFWLYNGATESDGSSVYFQTGLHLTCISPAPAPEPSTLLLFASGLVVCVGLRIRRRCRD